MKYQVKLLWCFLFILCCFSRQYSHADPLFLAGSVAVPLSINVVPTDVTCDGYSDGTITITITGPTAPYTISWTGGFNDTTSNSVYVITGLSKGTYWVVVDGSLFGETDSRFGILVGGPDPLVLNPPTSSDVTGCFGNFNGQISATGTDGTLPYTFTLKKSGLFYASNATGSFPVIPAGSYTVELDDAGSCGPEISGNIIIDQPAPVLLGTPSTTDVTCPTGSNGSISITASGGTSSFTYTLKKSGVPQGSNATGTFPGLSAGTYTVEAIDDNGCGPAVSGDIEIFEPLPITFSIPTLTEPNCNAGSDGAISITASGGTSGYSYELFIGAVSQESNTSGNFIGLSANTFTIQVTDSKGCGPESSGPIVLGEPTAVTLGAPSVTPVTGCFGNNNGSISIVAADGTPGYTYVLKLGGVTQATNTTGTFITLLAGVYTIEVTDDNNCGPVLSGPITVNQPAQLSLGAPTPTDVTVCFGNANGEISITGNGGTTPYIYTLKKSGVFQDSNASGTFTVLTAGTYTVELDDANFCGPVVSGDIILNEPSQVVLGTPSTSDVTCPTGSNGSISITASGGTSSFTYTLKKSGVPQGSNATGTFPGLSAGTYTVEAIDDNGCGPAVSGDIEIFEPLPITFSIPTLTEPNCNAGSDGAISITASGGTSGYSYELFIGAVSQESNTSGNFIGLSANTFTIQVTDSKGCGPESSGPIVLGEPTAVTLGAPSVTPVTGCFGNNNGSISIVAADGTPGYTYVLKLGGVTQATNTTGTFITLLAGVYTIEVTDDNNCGPVLSGPITVNQPAQLSLGAPTPTDVTVCFGNANGEISITGNGGTTPYIYTLKKSGVFQDSNASGTFTVLTAGTYTVELDDANFCGPVVSGDIILNEPSQVVLGTPSTSDVTCPTGSNGSISITASGGTSSFTYTLKKSGVPQGSNATGTFPGLSAGTYSVEAIDDNGCGPAVSGDIEITEPEAISIGTLDITGVRCFGDINGAITVAAAGGTPGYVYTLKKGAVIEDSNWHGSFINLEPATDYKIEITDTIGCGPFISNSITISEPISLNILTEIPSDITCNGANNGRIDIIASGGTSPYTYSINGGPPFVDNGGNFTGLSENTYTAAVKDTMDCIFIGGSHLIKEPTALSLVTDTTKATCNFGTPDGSMRLSVTGGTPLYEYSNDNGLNYQSDTSFMGLFAGNYDVVIKDDNDCLFSETVEIQGRITVNAYAGEDTSICPGNQYTLYASGGNTYLWTSTEVLSDPTSDTIVVSPSGVTSYILTATKELCEDKDTVILSNYPVLGIDAGDETTVQAGGTVVLTATAGFVNYLWLPAEIMTNQVGSSTTVTPLGNTMVLVTGTTPDGCLESDSVQVYIAEDLGIPSGFTPNNDGVNDTWEITNSQLYPDMVVDIFTRWGAKIFHVKGYNADTFWDGTRNGKDLPMGTYYYVIQLNDPFGTKPITGPLTIIR